MTMPNFLLIGANRAGTTSMHWYLDQHPEIYLSPIKEPMYFTLISMEIDKRNPIHQVPKLKAEVVGNLEAYQALFDGVTNEKAIGELSTSYLYSPDAANNIKRAIPNVKLLAILRNPIERAYSNYLAHLRWGIEDRFDFSEAIREEEKFLGDFGSQNWTYLKYGFYAKPLQTYYQLFDPTQLRIFLFDELTKNPGKLVMDVYRFLDVDFHFVPNVSNRENVSSELHTQSKVPPFTSEMRSHLVEIFRDDILELQDLIQRDLSSWLVVPKATQKVSSAKSMRELPKNVRLIAFYLPQYHPIAENDDWWGTNFTDWDNVKEARPSFHNHYQPRLPSELGFYDLRNPDIRQAQVDLAKEYGIFGFCYYHYWFNSKRLLEHPFNEVLASGKPDFPFCLCWANENWTRAWDGSPDEILIEQHYNPADDLLHITWLIQAFQDERYIRIDGKPLFLVYRASLLPRPLETVSVWREAARKAGMDLYLCAVESLAADRIAPARIGFDAAVEFQPDWLNLGSPSRRTANNGAVYDYSSVVRRMMNKEKPSYKRFPCVMPSWDNTARRTQATTTLEHSTPALYQQWLESVIRDLDASNPEEQLIFINAWNEWAEGAHLEPCQKWGRAYLEATRNALDNNQIDRQPASEFNRSADPDSSSARIMDEIGSLYLPDAGL